MTAATNRRNRRAQARSRRRAGASWSARATRQRRADTYSDPLFLTAVDGPSGRLATYVYDSESKRRRIYEGAAFTTIVWDGWDYLQWRRPSGTHVFHTMNGEIVGESVGGTVRDYLLDPLGSVVATLDSGGLVDQFEYWPYGELVDDLPAGAPVFLWVGGLGYWFDTDERRYVRHRMLRTDLGSWMQLDPLWPGTASLAYAKHSPVSIGDPSGLLTCEECARLNVTVHRFCRLCSENQTFGCQEQCNRMAAMYYQLCGIKCDGQPPRNPYPHEYWEYDPPRGIVPRQGPPPPRPLPVPAPLPLPEPRPTFSGCLSPGRPTPQRRPTPFDCINESIENGDLNTGKFIACCGRTNDPNGCQRYGLVFRQHKLTHYDAPKIGY